MTRNRKPPSGTPSESGREGAYLRGDVSQRPAESSVLSRGLENERGRRLGIAAPPATRQDSGRRRPRPEAPEDRRRGPWHAAVCPGSGSPRTTPRTGEGQGTAGRAPGDTRLTVTCRVTVPATIPSGAGGTVRRGRERVCSAPRRPARLLGLGPRLFLLTRPDPSVYSCDFSTPPPPPRNVGSAAMAPSALPLRSPVPSELGRRLPLRCLEPNAHRALALRPGERGGPWASGRAGRGCGRGKGGRPAPGPRGHHCHRGAPRPHGPRRQTRR